MSALSYLFLLFMIFIIISAILFYYNIYTKTSESYTGKRNRNRYNNSNKVVSDDCSHYSRTINYGKTLRCFVDPGYGYSNFNCNKKKKNNKKECDVESRTKNNKCKTEKKKFKCKSGAAGYFWQVKK